MLGRGFHFSSLKLFEFGYFLNNLSFLLFAISSIVFDDSIAIMLGKVDLKDF